MFLGPPPGFPPNGPQISAPPFGPQGRDHSRDHDRGRPTHPPPAIMEREHSCVVESREVVNERAQNSHRSPLNLSSPVMKPGRQAVTTPPTPVNQGPPPQNIIRPSTSGTNSCHSSPSPKEHLSSSNLSMVLNSFQLNYEQVRA